MQDSIDMVFHYVKLMREAAALLSWTPDLNAGGPYWTPEQVRKFHDHYLRRRDTSRFRLRQLLPNIENDAIPRGLAHEDPEVRRILLQELARRRADVSMVRGRASAGHDDSHAIGQAVGSEVGP